MKKTAKNTINQACLSAELKAGLNISGIIIVIIISLMTVVS